MRKNSIFKLFIILTGVIMLSLSYGRVEAAGITSVFSGETLSRDTLNGVNLVISSERESGNKYTWNPKTTGEAKTAWKISNIENGIKDYSNLYYCLNASRGFGITNGNMAEGAIDDYSSFIDMKNSDNKANITSYAGGSLGANYNKVLWILENSYIPTGSGSYKTSEEYKTLMQKAGNSIENNQLDLTEEQIEVVQQMAIWYFTNSDDTANYHLSSGNLPMIYLNDRQLSEYYFGTTQYGQQITGTKIYNKMNNLYRYFIENASSTYTTNEPTLTLSNSDVVVSEITNNYIVGPFSLNVPINGTTSSIKEITATINKTYTLLDSSKAVVTNNDFKKVIGKSFYLQIPKNEIISSTEVTIELTYKYDIRKLTLLTNVNDYTNTQPVVLIENKEEAKTINTNANINLTRVSVQKVWNDNNNQDNVRPQSITVNLLADGEKIDQKIVTASQNWTCSFDKLLKDKDGKTITYTVTENSVNNYTTSITGSENEGFVITNTHIPETIEVNGTKTWEDNDNQDGKRPERITINLFANNTKIKDITITANDGWRYSFKNLAKYENGVEIRYTITEEAVAGYTTKISGYNITNKYTPELVQKTVTKVWEDNNNQDGKRAEYGVTLKADGKTCSEEVKLTPNKTTYTWTNLPKYKDGREIVYTVEETTVPEEYTATYSSDTFTITNKYTPKVVQKTVTKVWEDNNNQDGKRAEYGVTLKADGIACSEEVKLTPSKTTYTWTNLPKYKDGREIVYAVEETTVPDEYTVTYSEDTFTITNKYTPGIVQKTVTKIWDDNNNQDGKRAEYGVTLKADGIACSEEVKLTPDKSTYTWTNLPKYKDGREIVYTVEETTVPEGYTATYSEDTFTITNEYNPEVTQKTVTKIWDDNNNQDGKRAEYGVTLKADGQIYREEVKINKDILTYTWTDLPKYKDGREIVYTVEETTVPEGYTVTYSEDTFTVTNRYTPGKVSKKVVKQWNDQNNKDGIRPNNVVVKLYKTVEGEKTELDSKRLDKTNNWMYTWNELDKKENGKEVVYSVEENAVDKYTTTYSAKDYSNTDEITIINTYVPVEITGKYNVVLRKVDENGNILEGSRFEVSGTEYDLSTGEIIIYENQQITKLEDINLTYIIEEILAPEGYNGIDSTEVNIKAQVQEVDNNYKLMRATLVDSEGNNITDEKISIKLEGQSIVIEVKNTPIEKQFDLALRKFVTKVNDIEYSREPVVDTSTIATTKTATYKHIKQPIPVQKGDIVTYTLRVYNEGQIAGYVNKITDYLPNNLIPIIDGINGIDTKLYEKEIEFNTNWLWSYAEDERTITTSITSKSNTETYSVLTGLEEVEDTRLEAYVEGADKLDYIDVQIKCLVINSNEILTGEYLTNIAEITESQDINGNLNNDIDSTSNNVNHSEITNYKNEEALQSSTESYISGQEDDDDFEKLVIQVYDLSLRKFITGVTRQGENINIGATREPIVNTKALADKTSTTAEYSHKKDPVEVQIGDVVTYTIRVYNEGSIDGIPAEITEYVPTYLDFDPNDEINKKYGWSTTNNIDNGLKVLKTNYYSDTILKAYSYEEGQELDSTKNYQVGDLKVNFIVNKTPTKKTIMTNTTEISKYQYANKEIAEDRDSGEKWELGIRDYGIKLMSDELYKNYVLTGEITQDKATEISGYVVSVMNDYKPDYEAKDYGLSSYLDSKGITGESFIANAPEGIPQEILLKAYEVVNSGGSNAEIAQAYKVYIDKFFQSYKGIVSNKDDLTDDKYYYVGQEDDDDFEKLRIVYFDLALRKFVTKVNSVDYNNRYPEIIYNEDGSITYKQTKEPVLVTTGDTVIYTIRIYNEGEITGYASEIKDNLPEGLAFDPNNEVNKLYAWKMIDKDSNVTEDAEKVVAFKTNYLENEKIDALVESNGSKVLSYKDVQIAFLVTESELSDRILVNIAQISADSDDDIDSIPDNNVEAEDDTDKEYIRVEYFDLSIKKWVTATKVTLDGKTTTTKTNYKEDSEAIAKVDIVASKLKKTTVKFVYNIKVTNEGELPGYAYEVKDYIPKGFDFVAEENKDWKEIKDGIVVTDKLKDTLLNPGESATVEIVLTWKNSSTNLGVKTNYAEISSDSANDIDSTPDNYDFTEDDMDDAQVILSIKTAGATTYIGLIFTTVAIFAAGVFLIKKYVLN